MLGHGKELSYSISNRNLRLSCNSVQGFSFQSYLLPQFSLWEYNLKEGVQHRGGPATSLFYIQMACVPVFYTFVIFWWKHSFHSYLYPLPPVHCYTLNAIFKRPLCPQNHDSKLKIEGLVSRSTHCVFVSPCTTFIGNILLRGCVSGPTNRAGSSFHPGSSSWKSICSILAVDQVLTADIV